MQQRDRVIALLDTSPTLLLDIGHLLAFGAADKYLHYTRGGQEQDNERHRRQTTNNVNASGVVFGSLGLNVDQRFITVNGAP